MNETRNIKYNFVATDTFEMIYQVTKKADPMEIMWVSDLVEEKMFQKLLSIERDWAVEQMKVV